VRGHAQRLSPIDYLSEDRGYETPCWIWQRGKDGDGYGVLTREMLLKKNKVTWFTDKKIDLKEQHAFLTDAANFYETLNPLPYSSQ
jgi:hypothetical protein